jgi:alpha-L-rhamnosidase
MTGFIGTAWISKALSLNGHSDIAYKLLTNEQYPSWLYPVTQGATTIWERLNSYTKDKGLSGNNSMNSFNHYSFGSVGAWMYQRMLGIQRKPQENAFKQFVLAPEPDWSGNITFASGHYDSLYGRIESGWKVDNDSLIYKARIPANTEAEVILPADAGTQVLLNGKEIKVNDLKRLGDKVHFNLGAGTYEFQTTVKHVIEQRG